MIPTGRDAAGLTLVMLVLLVQACTSDEVTTTSVTFGASDYPCFGGSPVKTLLVELHVPPEGRNCIDCYADPLCTIRSDCAVLSGDSDVQNPADLMEMASEIRFGGVDLDQPICLRAMTFGHSLAECAKPDEAPIHCASTPVSVPLSADSQVQLKVTCEATDVPCDQSIDLVCPDDKIDVCDAPGRAADSYHTCQAYPGLPRLCSQPSDLSCPEGEFDGCNDGLPFHTCVPSDYVLCDEDFEADCPQGWIDACDVGFWRHGCAPVYDAQFTQCAGKNPF